MNDNPVEPTSQGDPGTPPEGYWGGAPQQDETGTFTFVPPAPPGEVPMGPLYLQTPYQNLPDEPPAEPFGYFQRPTTPRPAGHQPPLAPPPPPFPAPSDPAVSWPTATWPDQQAAWQQQQHWQDQQTAWQEQQHWQEQQTAWQQQQHWQEQQTGWQDQQTAWQEQQDWRQQQDSWQDHRAVWADGEPAPPPWLPAARPAPYVGGQDPANPPGQPFIPGHPAVPADPSETSGLAGHQLPQAYPGAYQPEQGYRPGPGYPQPYGSPAAAGFDAAETGTLPVNPQAHPAADYPGPAADYSGAYPGDAFPGWPRQDAEPTGTFRAPAHPGQQQYPAQPSYPPAADQPAGQWAYPAPPGQAAPDYPNQLLADSLAPPYARPVSGPQAEYPQALDAYEQAARRGGAASPFTPARAETTDTAPLYYEPPRMDLGGGGFVPSDTSAIPIMPVPPARPASWTRPTAPAGSKARPAAAGEAARPARSGGTATGDGRSHGRRSRRRRERRLAVLAGGCVIIVAVLGAALLGIMTSGSGGDGAAANRTLVGGSAHPTPSYNFPVFGLTMLAPPSAAGGLAGALGSATSTTTPSPPHGATTAPAPNASGAPPAGH
jgi:hypothetical protein